MRAVLSVALGLLLGCGKVDPEPDKKPRDESGIVELDGDTVADFKDRTERYKGKTLRTTFRVDSSIFAPDSLRNYGGQDVKFFRLGVDGPQLDVVIRIPVGDIPNAAFGDKLAVTFVCKEGSLQSGNEATVLTRP